MLEKNLHRLIISNNLETLPEFLKNFTKIIELDISGNKFVNAPDVLCDLINLEILSIGSNTLKELPQNIGNLTKLRRLDLSNSQIRTIPGSFLRIIRNVELIL